MPSIRVQRVGKPLTLPDYERIIFEAVFAEAREIKRDYERTVSTWKEKPTFRLVRVGKFTYDVTTDSEIYYYVDEGTKPHIIVPVRAKALRFNTKGFKPKTSPRSLVATKGAQAKPPTAYAQKVNHPGTAPRRYTERLALKSQKRFARELRKAMKRVK